MRGMFFFFDEYVIRPSPLSLRYKLVRWLSSIIFILFAGRFFFLKSERFRKLWFEALFCMYRFLQYFRFTSIGLNA